MFLASGLRHVHAKFISDSSSSALRAFFTSSAHFYKTCTQFHCQIHSVALYLVTNEILWWTFKLHSKLSLVKNHTLFHTKIAKNYEQSIEESSTVQCLESEWSKICTILVRVNRTEIIISINIDCSIGMSWIGVLIVCT